ncbi:MAG: FG-GAP repeat domain-containing protein, partial [Planctomycetota bacterium]
AVSARHVARYSLGAWTDGNFNGDLRPDFAVETDEGLLVYLGDAKGRFAPGRTLRVPIPEAKDSDLSYLDLNRDGQTDVLAVQRKSGRAVVFTASPTKGLLKPYRFELAVPGHMRYPVLTDLNGDGQPDLALPYVPKPGFADAVRVLARGEFMVRAPVFLNRGGRRPFAATADTRLTLPVRMRMQADATGRIRVSGLIIVEYGGDLDGDGRKDFVVTERTDRLAVYRGVPHTVFRDEVWKHIDIPDCAAFDTVQSAAADLNGDNRSDIILHYRGEGRRPDQVHLLLSRKK